MQTAISWTVYRIGIPAVDVFARFGSYRTVSAVGRWLDRREREARYRDETVRHGMLRRSAVDRYDHRSDLSGTVNGRMYLRGWI